MYVGVGEEKPIQNANKKINTCRSHHISQENKKKQQREIMTIELVYMLTM